MGPLETVKSHKKRARYMEPQLLYTLSKFQLTPELHKYTQTSIKGKIGENTFLLLTESEFRVFF